MKNSNYNILKIIIGIPLILIIIWLIFSIYLTTQASTLVFDNKVSWAPVPNFGYKLEFLRDSKNRAIAIWTFENPESNKVILYLHGNSGKINDFFVDLKKYGTVVSPAYPGYHESEGIPNTSGVYETALLTYDYLVNKKGVDPCNIIIMGHSMGGSPAVYLASKRPDSKKLILINTFSSVKSMCERKYSVFCAFTGDILNTASYAPKVTIPVRQFVYKWDLSVPPEEGKNLYEKFTSSTDKNIFELDKYTHTYPDLNEIFEKAGEAN